jgi:hypothetical protein
MRPELPMATQAQIIANRANAQSSTGPRSSHGKAASAMNGLRHGFRSQSVLLPSEDPAEYQALLDELTEHFKPEDLTEDRCVREMVDAEWRLRRTRRNMEFALSQKYFELQTEFPETPDAHLEAMAFEKLHREDASFAYYLKYESKYERQYSRAYAEWTRYQLNRRNARIKNLQEAVLAPPPGWELREKAPEPPLQNRTTEPNSPSNPQPEKRTTEPNPVPRSAPCPCGSGQKYKRCCGQNAPAVLHTYAA